MYAFGTDMGYPIRNRGSSSSEPAETDSDMDKEETHLAAELVGGGLWLEDDWSATGSETSHHQVCVYWDVLYVAICMHTTTVMWHGIEGQMMTLHWTLLG